MDATIDALILIVGDDAVTERVYEELEAAGGMTVRVVLDPDSDRALHEAGVAEAASILCLSNDDERNLAVGLRARMLNPRIRVVIRQFSPNIGRKIEQNLPDSTVLSIAAHSAATFAGAALDPNCFFALRFPEADGDFVGFGRTAARELGVAGLTVEEAEARIGGRIVALGDQDPTPAGRTLGASDEVVYFSKIEERRTAGAPNAAPPAPPRREIPRFQRLRRTILATLRGINPIIRTVLLGGIVFYSSMLLFFHFVVQGSWEHAAFYVAETMTNAGFGDTAVAQRGPQVTAGAIVAMIGGTIFTSIFIGYVSSSITRAQWTAVQGLRHIRGRGHFIICGGGRTGSAVVTLLAAQEKHVVVIETHPDSGLLARARPGTLDVLTGDATHQDVLALCDLQHASAVIALTDSDAGNLEIALAARTLRPDIQLVVRMENRTFAQATAQVFGISTFSPAALTAPAFAGLARHPGTVGRVRYAGREHAIVYRQAGDVLATPLDPGAVPLCVWRDRELVTVRTLEHVRSGDVVLYAQPDRAAAGAALEV